MANGFYTAVGVWSVAGLHCLPLLVYLQGHMEAFDQVAQLVPPLGLSSQELQERAKVWMIIMTALRCV
jgi:hypothetical protein